VASPDHGGGALKIALVQNNYTVGDLADNAARIFQSVQRARESGADLVVTSELAITGYPPRDLLLRRSFVQRSWEIIKQLAYDLRKGPAVLVGAVEPNSAAEGRPLFNTAVLLSHGGIEGRFRKCLLPTYDVFDEDRYFEAARDPQVLRLGELSFGITICEDIWNDPSFWSRRRYHADPVEELAQSGVSAIINLSASPFSVGKQGTREAMLGAMARKHGLPMLYVNQVGGNDDLVFDGRSFCVDAQGRVCGRARSFAEDLLVFELENQSATIHPDDVAPEREIWQALVLGTRDYSCKCGFSSCLVGLSGGIDSSVTAAIAVEAMGAKNVVGVLMSSPFTSEHSIEDAQKLAHNLGIRTLNLPITGLMDGFNNALQEAFEGHAPDATEENIQARIRGNLLMSLSNKYRALLLTTGNKSELAVGYCTLYGDMCGGLAVISDVPKTMIYRLADYANRDQELIPRRVLVKAPSAELRPNQTDQQALPPYEVLDEILQRHVEHQKSVAEIVNEGYDEATVQAVLRMIKSAEFKRKQSPPGIKVTDRAFGTGWRMPIASQHDRGDLHAFQQNARRSVKMKKALSVIGLGKLGAPMAACFASKGFTVIGVDVDPQKIEAINKSRSPVYEPGLEVLMQASGGNFTATSEIEAAVGVTDITFIVVATPSEPGGGFSLQYVIPACTRIGRALRHKESFHIVCLTSTVMPGSTGGPVREALEEASGKRAGVDFGLCYNPEFIALGSVIRDFLNPDFLLIGESDPRSGKMIEDIYKQTCENSPEASRMNFINSEITKLSINTYVTTKISFANMLARICERLPGTNVDVITSALGRDSRIGTKYLKGAVSYGGPCFPRDNLALAALARKIGSPADLAEATDRFNRSQICWLADLVERHCSAVGTVGILGFTYKPNSDVIEESAGFLLAQELTSRDVRLTVFDPAGNGSLGRSSRENFRIAATAHDCIQESDVVVVVTPWQEFLSIPLEIWTRDAGTRTVIDCWRALRMLETCSGIRYVGLGTGDAAARVELAAGTYA
jgi:NAD+ synthase/NAD+ synthase (glutamine-hydrolysing)